MPITKCRRTSAAWQAEGRISSEILPNLHDKNDLKTLAVDKMDIEKTARI